MHKLLSTARATAKRVLSGLHSRLGRGAAGGSGDTTGTPSPTGVTWALDSKVGGEDASVLGLATQVLATLRECDELLEGETAKAAAYEQERVGAEKTAIVVVVEHPRNPRLVMAFVGAPRPTMIPRMLQSLQHYGDYTVVGFQSDAVDSTLALRVSAVSSSMALVVRPGVASSLLPPAALILPSSAP